MAARMRPHARLSVAATAGSPEKKRSMMCAVMSVTPAAVWYAGSVKVSLGSRNEICGRMSSLVRPRLKPSSSLLITQEFEPSEPEAGMVTTVTMGRARSGCAAPVQKSHGSPSRVAPSAMALAQSMAEPPPTGSTTSTRSARASLQPVRTRPISGLGRTPPSSTKGMPAASSEDFTRSSVPVRTTEPWPYTMSARVKPAAASSAPTESVTSPPKMNLVGEQKVKLFMASFP